MGILTVCLSEEKCLLIYVGIVMFFVWTKFYKNIQNMNN
jgi:hypothetical protein